MLIKHVIKHDGNDASILGILYEVMLYYVRVGLFVLLFEHKAAPVKGFEKIAVDSVDSAFFILGLVDEYSFDAPCTGTPAPRSASFRRGSAGMRGCNCASSCTATIRL